MIITQSVNNENFLFSNSSSNSYIYIYIIFIFLILMHWLGYTKLNNNSDSGHSHLVPGFNRKVFSTLH